jgi:DNA polymerase-3 subunit delta'
VDISGHRNILDYFRSAINRNRLGHAYMFMGKSGIGKRMVATQVTMMFNCERGDACGECGSCLQIAKGTHPDVTLIDFGDGESHKIEVLREILPKVFMRKFSSEYRVFIMDKVDLMTMQAADAFLKTLEEPPPNVVFFLITDKPYAVSNTIRSRTQKVWFALKANELLDLVGVRCPDSDAATLTALAEGSVGRALEAAAGDLCTRRQEVYGSLPERFSVETRDRDEFRLNVQLVLSFLRDCLVHKLGARHLTMNRDRADLIEACAGRWQTQDIVAAVDTLVGMMTTADNVNLGLASAMVENLL